MQSVVTECNTGLSCNISRPLRILQVNTWDIAGGAEGSAWNLFHAFRTRGHDSYLAVGYKRSNDKDVLLIPNDKYRSRWERAWLAIGAPVRLLKGKVRKAEHLYNIFRWIGNPRGWIEWRRGIEDFDFPETWRLMDLTPKPPDIIHCHNLHGGYFSYFDLSALPWLSHKVPIILNLRDAWLLSGHCAHFFDCRRWITGCGECPYLNTYPALKRDATAYNWKRKREIYQKSKLYIVTPSQWLMDKVKASMLSGVQYRVIPNGIDMTIFHPGDRDNARRILGLPVNAKIILLSAHNEFKDYDTMETALRHLDKSGKDDLIFVCLGKGGLGKNIGKGRMIYRRFESNPHRMALYYHASDIFIHAAKDEAFGKTVTEAMACGIPVVATAVGGIKEQIEDGKTGFLAPSGDSKAMSKAIRVLLMDAGLRASLRQAGFVNARKRFDLRMQVDAYLKLYTEILCLERENLCLLNKSQ